MIPTVLIALLTFILLAVIIYFVIIFNGFKRLISNIEMSQSNIDVLLKQRFDEIPNLVRVCKGYIGYESKILKDITELRSKFETTRTIINKNKLNQILTDKMNSLDSIVESYPNLKSSEQFLNLQRRISEIEMEIADRREFYNDGIAVFNTRVESFPDIIIAKIIMGYKKQQMFKFQEVEEEYSRLHPEGGLR